MSTISVRICLAGATGSVGRRLVPAIVAADDLILSSAVARRGAGTDVGTVLGRARVGVQVTDDIIAALDQEPDVLIDYTHPSVIRQHIAAAFERGVNVVIGTSGLRLAEYEEIDGQAKKAGVGAIRGNYSMTGALLQRFARIAGRHIPSWEVVEYADAAKVDAPGGTAIDVAGALKMSNGKDRRLPHDEGEERREARGADIGGTRIHSVRVPGYDLACEVIFGLQGERLIIRHEAAGSSDIFVEGTLAAARKVGAVKGLVHGFDWLLFGDATS